MVRIQKINRKLWLEDVIYSEPMCENSGAELATSKTIQDIFLRYIESIELRSETASIDKHENKSINNKKSLAKEDESKSPQL